MTARAGPAAVQGSKRWFALWTILAVIAAVVLLGELNSDVKERASAINGSRTTMTLDCGSVMNPKAQKVGGGEAFTNSNELCSTARGASEKWAIVAGIASLLFAALAVVVYIKKDRRVELNRYEAPRDEYTVVPERTTWKKIDARWTAIDKALDELTGDAPCPQSVYGGNESEHG